MAVSSHARCGRWLRAGRARLTFPQAPRNTIGNVPLEWYKDHDHIGYDLAGKKIIRKGKKDGIDRFLASRDDPNYRWTVRDEENDEDVVLSRREVEIIRQIHTGKFPHPEFDAFPDYIPYFSSIREIHPVIDAPEPKRRFLPSKWEKMKIMKLVKLIKEGKLRRGNASVCLCGDLRVLLVCGCHQWCVLLCMSVLVSLWMCVPMP